MGAGVAKSIRTAYPSVYETYLTVCKLAENPNNLLGKAIPSIGINDKGTKIIINLFSQLNIRKGISDKRIYTNYDALRESLHFVSKNYKGATIAIPYKIGCGLAGGDWHVVKNIILEELCDFNITIYDKYNERSKD